MFTSSFLSDPPSIEDIDMKIESLNHKIILIREEIQRLKEYKNTRLLTVSKLPPEVLSTIFESLEKSATSRRLAAYDHLLAATQVCRLWRRVALDLPQLWSCIFTFAPPRIVKLFLGRTASAPLYLQGPYPPYNKEDTVDATLNHLDRLKEITLSSDHGSKWAKRITSEPAPQLEILSLENSSRTSVDSFWFPGDTDIFPALRHLSLKGYVFKADAATLTNLRSLKIDSAQSTYYGGRSSTAHYADPVDFFTSLDCLPFLSSLDLTNALAPLDGPIPPLSVGLPNLLHLSIKDADISNLGMMSCIRAPLIRTVKLSHTGRVDTVTVAPIMAAIYSNLHDLPESYSRFKLQPILRHPSQIDALVRVWAGCAVEARETVTPFFDLKVSVIGGLEAAGPVFTLCPLTTLPPSLHFQSDVKLFANDPLTRGTLFSQLENVTELHCDNLTAICLALCNGHLRTNRARPLPSLRKIVLYAYLSIDREPGVLVMLREELYTRKAAGAGIETWQVVPGFLQPSDLVELKDIIDIVETASSQERCY
ncbi:hypothetical protein EYR40_009385 [Pleurotus pulmonarius]|nr:hypothetical protein EYR38_009516 [Pleurotus pulmonarius]KAF4590788.1 hypothetical protein EYR40_009385 [Pleurotus pulmonarius]